MRKGLLGLALLGAMLPATASAAEVSPSKQAQLEQHGWTVHDSGSTEPMVMVETIGFDCRWGAVKKIASSIDGYNGPMVRHRVKMAVCARGGRITRVNSSYAAASPGRAWGPGMGPWVVRWRKDRVAGIRGANQWPFYGVIEQWWLGRITVEVSVVRKHQLVWRVKRRWF